MAATTISKSFTAVGVSGSLAVKNGDSITYSVSGTFSATILVEQSVTGGASWEPIATITGSASGIVSNNNKGGQQTWFRLRCSVFTSGTVVTTLVENAATLSEIKNDDGEVIFRRKEDGMDVFVRPSQKIITSAAGQSKVGGTAGFVVAVADNIALVTCPASQTAAKLVVPITGLKVGDIITSFHLIGQIESAGGTATVDADLRKMTAAAADVTDASIGSITQLSVTADTIMSETNTAKTLATADTVGADETFYVLITATTAAATDIALQGVAVVVTEN